MTKPLSRWATLPPSVRLAFAAKLDRLASEGADVAGEARLADALLPRAARILDAGSGTGRVGGELLARGHDVTAVEQDPDLLAWSRRDHPDLAVIQADLLDLTPELLIEHGRPTAYDLVLLVGNVLVFLADGTERDVLRALRAVLAPDGRILVGLDLHGHREGSRAYRLDQLLADVGAVGLTVQLHAGSYDLRPPTDTYAVLVLGR